MTDEITVVSIENPDIQSVSEKTDISYTISNLDILNLLGSQSNAIQVANSSTFQVITIADDGTETTTGTSYYTPLYTEKIKYDEWLNTVNKNFNELT